MVKLAVGAVLATMLVRFPWFRRILLTEKRDWPERLIFAASLGLPLTAGVLCAAPAQLRRRRPDAVGRVSRRAARRTVRRRHRRRDGGHPGVHRRRMDRAALRGRLRICRRRPARDLPEGSDLALLAAVLHRSAPPRLAAGPAVRDRLGRDPAGRADRPRDHPAGARATTGRNRLFLLHGTATSPAMWFVIPLATVLSVAIPIKIWNSARIEHRLQEQEKLLMAARLDALASQINPHFLFNTLTSISSLIRSQARNRADADREALGPAAAAAAQPGAFRHAARRARSDRRVPRHREHPLRPAAARREGHRSGHARSGRPEHAAAAARRELDQARPLAEARRRPHHDPQPARERATRSSTSSTTASASDASDSRTRDRHWHRPEQRQRAAARDLRRQLPAPARQRARRRHVRAHRDSGAGQRRSRASAPDMPPSSLRTVVVDDEQLAREELCFLLEQLGGVEVVGAGRQRHRGAARDRGTAAGPRDARRPDAGAHRLRGRAARRSQARRRFAARVRHRVRSVRASTRSR